MSEENLLIISAPGMYTKSFNLVTTDEYLQASGAKMLISFLRALHEAERRLSHYPDEMTVLLSKQLEQSIEKVRNKLSETQLQLSMDKTTAILSGNNCSMVTDHPRHEQRDFR